MQESPVIYVYNKYQQPLTNKFFGFFFRAAPMAYRGSQAKGRIGATAAGPRHSHNNKGSKPCLQPTP